jgi:hypothetical protein
MPSVFRESASDSIRLDGLDVRLENLEGGVRHAGAAVVELSPNERLGTAIGTVMANLGSGRRDR